MTLIQQVIEAVHGLPECTVEDLMPKFPQRRKDQVLRALQTAASQRRIAVIEPAQMGGIRTNTRPAVYGPADTPEEDGPLKTRTCYRGEYGIPRVASVWQLGSAA